jgi:hypothetical protein
LRASLSRASASSLSWSGGGGFAMLARRKARSEAGCKRRALRRHGGCALPESRRRGCPERRSPIASDPEVARRHRAVGGEVRHHATRPAARALGFDCIGA